MYDFKKQKNGNLHELSMKENSRLVTRIFMRVDTIKKNKLMKG